MLIIAIALLAWSATSAGATPRPNGPAPIVGIEPFDNPIFW